METFEQKTGSAGSVQKQFFTFAEPQDEMVLESGARLGPITIAYETWGTLSDAKDNVILLAHAFSGDSHAAGYYSEDPEDAKPGWWDFMIGPGKGTGYGQILRYLRQYPRQLHGLDRPFINKHGNPAAPMDSISR